MGERWLLELKNKKFNRKEKEIFERRFKKIYESLKEKQKEAEHGKKYKEELNGK